MNKRFTVLLIAFALAGTVAQAQLNQADKLFNSYSYSLAIPQYLKVAQNPKDKDYNYAVVRLADCYRLVNDQLNAKAWYAKAVTLPNTENMNWFYYGEALRCAQEYELAKEAYLTYASLNPDDMRGKDYAAFCDEIPRLNVLPVSFEIKNAGILNSERSDFGPAFYNGGIIFVSDRRQNFMDNNKYEWTNYSYLDLFFAAPRYIDEFFQEMNEPKVFSGKFNQTFHDGPASFARHDSIVYLTRTYKGKEKKDSENFRTDRLKIFWAKFDGSWSKLEPFSLNSDNYSVGHPVLTPDGNTLYFVSDMPESLGGTDIFSCSWNGGGWSQPKNLGPEVNSAGDEMFPAVCGDHLYFASSGFAGFGGLDLFKTKQKDGKWSKPENLGQPVNSSFDDFAIVLDPKSKKGFFSSNRPGGLGSDDIYACRIIEKKKEDIAVKKDSLKTIITGFVKDKQTLKPMAGSTVFLLNTQTDKVDVIKTDANGRFTANINKGIFYVAKAMENNFVSDCINFKFDVADTTSAVKTPRDLLLDRLVVDMIFSVNNIDNSVETIYYDFDKWFIRPDAEKELDKLVQLMKENPVSVELGSHTDSRGSREYNIDLSQKRAESAVRYITLQGIPLSRITAKGYGESQLINHCSDGVACSAAEHQENRRTEFKVTGFTKADDNSDYDMSKFKGDEEIPVYMFDRDFFINCLQEKKMAKYTSDKNPETQISPVLSPATVDPVQVAEVKKPPMEKSQPGDKKLPEDKPAVKEQSSQTVTDPVAAEPVVSTGVISYRVQLMALSYQKSLLDSEFEVLDDVQMYIENGLYKYTSGVFNTHAEAIAYRSTMIELGYDDSFVVSFVNGKRIYITPSY
jgi:outer membrane protein OmpA-like peptidoglycan-associated protein/tetratricopeptide (TPR) repeat protein